MADGLNTIHASGEIGTSVPGLRLRDDTVAFLAHQERPDERRQFHRLALLEAIVDSFKHQVTSRDSCANKPTFYGRRLRTDQPVFFCDVFRFRSSPWPQLWRQYVVSEIMSLIGDGPQRYQCIAHEKRKDVAIALTTQQGRARLRRPPDHGLRDQVAFSQSVLPRPSAPAGIDACRRDCRADRPSAHL